MPPVGALHEGPPLAPVPEIGDAAWRHEHQRAGIDHVRQRAGILLRVGRNLRRGYVAGGLHEFLELPVRHRRAVDPETIDRHTVRWRLFGIVMVRSHAERAAGNEDHVAGCPVVMLAGMDLDVRLYRGTHYRTSIPERLAA